MLRIVAFCSLLLLAAGCGKQAGTESASAWSEDEQLMYFGISVRVLFKPADKALEKELWRYLHQVDDRYNDWRDDTEVARVNTAAAGTEVQLSEEFVEVWRLCERVHAATGGVFDPTVRPLRQLWRTAEASGEAPAAETVAETLAHCGMDKVTVSEAGILTKADAAVGLDFGGVIKGFAVDHVTDVLRAAGHEAGLVQIGGETAVWGISKRGKPHAIAIQHPLDMAAYWTVLEDPGSGFSCATSGNYRNPIKIGGQTYYHVFDPRTGQPVNTNVLSVTILFPEPGKNGLADALSTAGAVLGAEETLRIATEFGAQALVLVRDGEGVEEFATPGFAAFRRAE